jgi:putative transposase
MTTPRHRAGPACSYFVTTKCAQGRRVFQIPEVADICVEALLHYRDKREYLLHEFVLMPDHLHLLLTPGENSSLERAMQLIKGGSSFRIHRARRHRMDVWQDGFFDWTIRDESDWGIKSRYIRMNPVRAELVELADDWKYGSASGRYVMDNMPVIHVGEASRAKAPLRTRMSCGG